MARDYPSSRCRPALRPRGVTSRPLAIRKPSGRGNDFLATPHVVLVQRAATIGPGRQALAADQPLIDEFADLLAHIIGLSAHGERPHFENLGALQGGVDRRKEQILLVFLATRRIGMKTLERLKKAVRLAEGRGIVFA